MLTCLRHSDFRPPPKQMVVLVCSAKRTKNQLAPIKLKSLIWYKLWWIAVHFLRCMEGILSRYLCSCRENQRWDAKEMQKVLHVDGQSVAVKDHGQSLGGDDRDLNSNLDKSMALIITYYCLVYWDPTKIGMARIFMGYSLVHQVKLFVYAVNLGSPTPGLWPATGL